MTTFFLSLKRLVFSKGFILSLLILPMILIITSVGFKNSENKTIAKAGIFFETSDDIIYFEKLIENDNFIIVNSYEELEKSVANGKLDCGFKISKDFGELLEKVKLDESIEVITTERSEMAPFFTQEITAYTADVSVPYISAKMLDTSGETNLSYDEILKDVKIKYEKSISEESVIFEFKEISGKSVESEGSLYTPVIKGLIAIILFVFSLVSVEQISDKTVISVSERINNKNSELHIYIPFGISFTLCILISSGIGIFISDMIMPMNINIAELILHIFVYSILLLGISFLISSFVRNISIINALIAPILTVSAIICPIFTDIRDTNVFFQGLFFICPPCYLFGYEENIILFSIISIFVFVIGCFSIFISRKKAS
ncbi:MAG: hypothetical protein IJY83_02530 [Oscillospiraceae bacterium]|nr:hypothetical protein [Oscillospiraceae bacterium]